MVELYRNSARVGRNVMSILDAVKKAEEQSRASTVPFAEFRRWLDGLSSEDRKALEDALRSGRVSVKALHAALREEGVAFGPAPLYDYRKQLMRKFLG